MKVSTRVLALGVLLLTMAVGSAAAAGLGDAPDSTYHSTRDATNVIVGTSPCPGFATSSPLHFGGELVSAYAHWNSDNTEAGFTLANVRAADGAHTYRITQLYLFWPRQFREYVYGWAKTWVVRNDGAMMVGASWLGVDPTYPGGGAEGVWWTGTPACIGPKR